MTFAEPPGWTFERTERSAGDYEGTGLHVTGASVRASDSDPDNLLEPVREDARDVEGSLGEPS